MCASSAAGPSILETMRYSDHLKSLPPRTPSHHESNSGQQGAGTMGIHVQSAQHHWMGTAHAEALPQNRPMLLWRSAAGESGVIPPNSLHPRISNLLQALQGGYHIGCGVKEERCGEAGTQTRQLPLQTPRILTDSACRQVFLISCRRIIRWCRSPVRQTPVSGTGGAVISA